MDFILPDIGEGISEAQLIDWTVGVGQRVREGETVATISTDKVNVELPAPCDGTVLALCVHPGDTVPVGTVLVRIDDGEAVASTAAGSGAVAIAPAAPQPAPVSAPAPQPGPAPVTASAPAPRPRPTGAVVASPSTRRRAAELGVDLAAIAGSGPDGRILRRDVEAAAAPAASPALAFVPDLKREALAGMRAVAAERLARSVHTAAHSTMSFEVRVDGLEALIARLEPAAQARGVRLTPTVLFARCVAAALPAHPRFNATVDPDRPGLVLHEAVDLGLAVATDAGLVVPVLRDAGALGLFALAGAVADVAGRARDGRLAPADVQGGSFTLSCTGGLERATILSTRPVINPPQTATLWMSRINDRPWAAGGALVAARVVAGSLSFDHRFIDGADATRFINDLAALLETPEVALAGV